MAVTTLSRTWQDRVEAAAAAMTAGQPYDPSPPRGAPQRWGKALRDALAARKLVPYTLYGASYLLPADPALAALVHAIETEDLVAVAVLADWLEERGCPLPLPLQEARKRAQAGGDPAAAEVKGAVATTPLRLDSITASPEVQPRERLSEHTVQEYVEALARNEKLPPVVVYREGRQHWLADGWHRLEAHRRADRKRILAAVREGTRRDAILYAAGANTTHGLPRTAADKRRAVRMLLGDPEWATWSDREIARRCAVSDWLVRDVRAQVCQESASASPSQIGAQPRTARRGGATYTMETGRIGGRARPAAPGNRAPDSAAGRVTIDDIQAARIGPCATDLLSGRVMAEEANARLTTLARMERQIRAGQEVPRAELEALLGTAGDRQEGRPGEREQLEDRRPQAKAPTPRAYRAAAGEEPEPGTPGGEELAYQEARRNYLLLTADNRQRFRRWAAQHP